jgi:hypothetical protein
MISLFPIWTRLEKQGPGSKPLWDQFGPFQNERCQNGFKRVRNMISLFPIWTRLEKQGPGAKPLWDQFGPFQNEKCQNGFKKEPIGMGPYSIGYPIET